jgi:hypothetical protein
VAAFGRQRRHQRMQVGDTLVHHEGSRAGGEVVPRGFADAPDRGAGVGWPCAWVHVNAAPPHSRTSMPRCCWYQDRSAAGSRALKKMPPMPVTLFICAPTSEFELEAGMSRGPTPFGPAVRGTVAGRAPIRNI